MSSIEKVKDEYPEEYCTILEVAYGDGFLSEGGTEAIDNLLVGFELENKEILDIGSGLGGAATYIAQKHRALVTGIEINQQMVDESNCRLIDSLKDDVKFLYYNDINHLPFPSESFDLVYSKGVFLHLDVPDKLALFKEIFRVLKKDSYFIIGDWLSPKNGDWGDKMKQMMESDGLTLFANTEEDYRQVITRAGFKLISISDFNDQYLKYNMEIVEHLKKNEIQKLLKNKFDDKEINSTIHGYQLIVDSINEKELLVRKILSKKIDPSS
ncbi:methyltransferase domain-containing protein [Methanobacterium alcaliphilum]|uniref:methyltransferase domain-containing protein n=1 Tax=Methanobacterium alcaliphilum TaxID=392018 RepID=UPI00200B2A0E|nr:methyltransferase domain-containing protein [Methanobacterium alcaliphilum]MCK9150418.1 methyltransferase domain-containing protein [Methanobacterium alcaliphilum]